MYFKVSLILFSYYILFGSLLSTCTKI